MWVRITLGLVGILAVLLAVLFMTHTVTVSVEVPQGTSAPTPAWMGMWLFILFSAVIIVGVTAVRMILKVFRRKISN